MERPEICSCGHSDYLVGELDRALEHIERAVEELERSGGRAVEVVNDAGLSVTNSRQFVEAHRAAQRWNRRHQSGATVHYHPVLGREHFRVTTTCSSAWVIGGHTAVVKVESERACVAIANLVEVVPK